MSLRRIFFCQFFWASRIVGDYCEDFSLCQRRPNKEANNSTRMKEAEGSRHLRGSWQQKLKREFHIFFIHVDIIDRFPGSTVVGRQPEIVTVDDKNNILLTNNIMKWESDKAFLSVRCYWQAELNNKKYFFPWKQPSLAGGGEAENLRKILFLSFFFSLSMRAGIFSSFAFFGASTVCVNAKPQQSRENWNFHSNSDDSSFVYTLFCFAAILHHTPEKPPLVFTIA